MISPEQIFEIWAPDGAPWSPWVKPVLFAHMTRLPDAAERHDIIPEIPGIPPADQRTAILIDLPGYGGVWAGIALAGCGYRPVPLYNAAPGPTDCSLVDVWPIVHALAGATGFLRAQPLPWAAPPAFLLDASRRGVGIAALPGWFDNRSVSFPTDFPGAGHLLSHGIHRVILLQEDRLDPQPDLAHTLRGWQAAGIEMHAATLVSAAPPRPIVIQRPRFYRWVWHRLLTTLGLRRNPLGGFGGMMPEASAG